MMHTNGNTTKQGAASSSVGAQQPQQRQTHNNAKQGKEKKHKKIVPVVRPLDYEAQCVAHYALYQTAIEQLIVDNADLISTPTAATGVKTTTTTTLLGDSCGSIEGKMMTQDESGVKFDVVSDASTTPQLAGNKNNTLMTATVSDILKRKNSRQPPQSALMMQRSNSCGSGGSDQQQLLSLHLDSEEVDGPLSPSQRQSNTSNGGVVATVRHLSTSSPQNIVGGSSSSANNSALSSASANPLVAHLFTKDGAQHSTNSTNSLFVPKSYTANSSLSSVQRAGSTPKARSPLYSRDNSHRFPHNSATTHVHAEPNLSPSSREASVGSGGGMSLFNNDGGNGGGPALSMFTLADMMYCFSAATWDPNTLAAVTVAVSGGSAAKKKPENKANKQKKTPEDGLSSACSSPLSPQTKKKRSRLSHEQLQQFIQKFYKLSRIVSYEAQLAYSFSIGFQQLPDGGHMDGSGNSANLHSPAAVEPHVLDEAPEVMGFFLAHMNGFRRLIRKAMSDSDAARRSAQFIGRTANGTAIFLSGKYPAFQPHFLEMFGIRRVVQCYPSHDDNVNNSVQTMLGSPTPLNMSVNTRSGGGNQQDEMSFVSVGSPPISGLDSATTNTSSSANTTTSSSKKKNVNFASGRSMPTVDARGKLRNNKTLAAAVNATGSYPPSCITSKPSPEGQYTIEMVDWVGGAPSGSGTPRSLTSTAPTRTPINNDSIATRAKAVPAASMTPSATSTQNLSPAAKKNSSAFSGDATPSGCLEPRDVSVPDAPRYNIAKLIIPADDEPSYNMKQHFNSDVMEFICGEEEYLDKHHLPKGNVLIHCSAGMHRAPTIAAAALLYDSYVKRTAADAHIMRRDTAAANGEERTAISAALSAAAASSQNQRRDDSHSPPVTLLPHIWAHIARSRPTAQSTKEADAFLKSYESDLRFEHELRLCRSEY